MFKNITNALYKDENYLLDNEDMIKQVLGLNITPLVLINSMIRTDSFLSMLELLNNKKDKRIFNTKEISTQTEQESFSLIDYNSD